MVIFMYSINMLKGFTVPIMFLCMPHAPREDIHLVYEKKDFPRVLTTQSKKSSAPLPFLFCSELVLTHSQLNCLLLWLLS